MHIKDVKEGLRKGRAFVRETLECIEYLKPIGDGMFNHSVSGMNEQGGWGGSADLEIDLLPGRFDEEGWSLM